MSGLLLFVHDGPLAGKAFDVTRCPREVRLVRSTATGKCDVLNLPEDEPEPDEAIFGYRYAPGLGRGHVCGRPGCSTTVWLVYAPELGLDAPAASEQLTLDG